MTHWSASTAARRDAEANQLRANEADADVRPPASLL